MREQILKLITDSRLRLLMYPGGTGGEFLSSQLAKYCNKFRDDVNVSYDSEKNLTHVQLPHFFESIAAAWPSSRDNMCLVNTILHWHEINQIDLLQSLTQAETFLDAEKLPPLIRLHHVDSDIFNNDNTWKIWLSTPHDRVYAFGMLLIKRGSSPLTASRLQAVLNYYSARSPTNASISNRAQSVLMTSINSGYNCIVAHHNVLIEAIRANPEITDSELTDLSKLDAREITKSNIDRLLRTPNPIRSASDSTVHIPFSDILKPGVLAEYFELPDDTVRQNMIQWHLKNVELIKKIGLDPKDFEKQY